MHRSELTGWHGFGPGVARNSIVTSEMQGSCGWRCEREGKGLEEDGGRRIRSEAGTSPGAYIYGWAPETPAIFHHYADTTLGLVSIYLSISPFSLPLSLSNPKRKRKGRALPVQCFSNVCANDDAKFTRWNRLGTPSNY